MMFLPKLNRMVHPPLGIRTGTGPEAMTGMSIFTVFDVYSGISQIFNASIHRWYRNDAVILAHRNERRGEMFGKKGMTGIGDNDDTRLWEIISTKSGGALHGNITDHPGAGRTAPQGIIRSLPAFLKI
jgi:hypothetical protein